jgi:hypothetical protein
MIPLETPPKPREERKPEKKIEAHVRDLEGIAVTH